MIPIICSLQGFGENRFFSTTHYTNVSVILPSGIPDTTNSLLYYIFFSYRIPYCLAKPSQYNESQLSAFTLYALAEDRSTVIFKILWTKVRRFLTSCLHNSPKSWKISSRQNKSWKEFFTTREHLLSILDRHLLLHIFYSFYIIPYLLAKPLIWRQEKLHGIRRTLVPGVYSCQYSFSCLQITSPKRTHLFGTHKRFFRYPSSKHSQFRLNIQQKIAIFHVIPNIAILLAPPIFDKKRLLTIAWREYMQKVYSLQIHDTGGYTLCVKRKISRNIIHRVNLYTS